MTIALTILSLALVALLAYREWGFIRERAEAAAVLLHEKVEAATALARSRDELAAERDRAAEERRELYQRIQAPDVAVHDAQLEARRQRPYVRREPVGADNDAAFAARRAERQAERDREVASG